MSCCDTSCYVKSSLCQHTTVRLRGSDILSNDLLLPHAPWYLVSKLLYKVHCDVFEDAVHHCRGYLHDAFSACTLGKHALHRRGKDGYSLQRKAKQNRNVGIRHVQACHVQTGFKF